MAYNTVLVSLHTASHRPVTDHHQSCYPFHTSRKCVLLHKSLRRPLRAGSESTDTREWRDRINTYTLLVSDAIVDFGSDVSITARTRQWVDSERDPSTAFLEGDIKIFTAN